MVNRRGFLMVSLIAIMAVGNAYAGAIATSDWVTGQIGTVDTKIDDHIDNSNVHVTAEQKAAWTGKQDAIDDLADIRAGAALGATAIQSHQTITTGETNGTISVGGTDVAVAGLGSAAYENANAFDAAGTATNAIAALDLANTYQPKGDYATAAQGAKADTAVQPASLAAVATSGDYDDLSNKPTIPAAQVNSDWDATSGVAQILNKPTLGDLAAKDTVALTDLASDVQTSLGKADTAIQSHQTITTGETNGTISVGGTDVAVAGLGSAAYENANAFDAAGTATNAIAALDLANTYQPKGNYATAAQGAKADTAVQPGLLAAVATSGDYDDLLNKPTIPDVSGKEDTSNKETNTSSYNASSTTNYPSMAVASQMITNAINTSTDEITNTIQGKQAKLTSNGTNANVKFSGDGNVVTDVTALNGVVTVTKGSTLATVATSGSYNDLTDTPTIPAAQVNSDWDATSGVAQILNKPTLGDLAAKDTVALADLASTVQTSLGYADDYHTASASYGDIITHNANEFATAAQGAAAASAIQGVQKNGTDLTPDANGVVNVTVPTGALASKDTVALTDLASTVQTSLGKADTAVQPGLLAAVATSGSYNDLSNKPTIDTALSSTSTNAVQNKVVNTALAGKQASLTTAQLAAVNSGITGDKVTTYDGYAAQITAKANSADLATVATSGSYNDLSNKPTIPAAQVNSDWDATSGVAQILNKPTLGDLAAKDTVALTDLASTVQTSLGKADTAVQPGLLAAVATSGSYNDLSNKPTIDTALSSTSTNAVQNKVVNTALAGKQASLTTAQLAAVNSGITGDKVTTYDGYAAQITAKANSADLATVATSGSYNDLLNKPTIPAAQVNSDWNATSGKAQILNKPTLATVATSGSYNDLSNKPTIPDVSGKEDTSNKETNTSSYNASSTTNYPSMAVASQMITNAINTSTDEITGTVNGKQPKSTANYQMGKAGGGWTIMTTQQQNMLNGKIPSGSETSTTGATIWVE